MGFFVLPDRAPEDDDLDDEDEDDGFEGMRPAAWVAGIVPIELLVARSEQAAVVVSRISAYPEGIELTVNTYLHRSVKRRRRRHLHDPMLWHDIGEPGEPVPDELLRFGLTWPDGGRATNLDGWGRSWKDATEPSHGLETHGGGGSDREYSQEYWAWPLADSGPLGVVVEWPAFGIEETTGEIDGALLAAAASRARPVWAEDAGKPSHFSRARIMRASREQHDGPASGLVDL